jgi:hypothetical protein
MREAFPSCELAVGNRPPDVGKTGPSETVVRDGPDGRIEIPAHGSGDARCSSSGYEQSRSIGVMAGHRARYNFARKPSLGF